MGERSEIVAITIGLGLVAVVASLKLLQPSLVNHSIKKDCEKCVNTYVVGDMEELKKPDGKAVFCRCWRSKTFPYCDGSHAAHNKLTGDNVGPLIIKASS
mmetsp:Transcript_75945/g.176160  ORF Transcript_75945/g.176160 Transcript_75945/m.176160 type:complete len:100 (+) Transcript_75945:55-354(+)